ncbi:MAG TPA: hypothetical protein VIP80_09205 [Gemmatimonadales bacterium]|jgi:hypothetical protein
MNFKPAIWYPIAVLLSLANLVAVGFAVGPGPPWHAMIHAGLALGFGLWAYRLRQPPRGGEFQARFEGLEAELNRLDALANEVGTLRHELGEAQERLDFVERVLARGAEARRVEPG